MSNTPTQKVGGRIRFPAPPGSAAPRNVDSTGFGTPRRFGDKSHLNNSSNSGSPYRNPFSPMAGYHQSRSGFGVGSAGSPFGGRYNHSGLEGGGAASPGGASNAKRPLSPQGGRFGSYDGSVTPASPRNNMYYGGYSGNSGRTPNRNSTGINESVNNGNANNSGSIDSNNNAVAGSGGGVFEGYMKTSPRSPAQTIKELPSFLLNTAQGRSPTLDPMSYSSGSGMPMASSPSPPPPMNEFGPNVSYFSPNATRMASIGGGGGGITPKHGSSGITRSTSPAGSLVRSPSSSSTSARRKMSFGTNDMLSLLTNRDKKDPNDYISADDAPPITSLDDMDLDSQVSGSNQNGGRSGYRNMLDNSSMMLDEDPRYHHIQLHEPNPFLSTTPNKPKNIYNGAATAGGDGQQQQQQQQHLDEHALRVQEEIHQFSLLVSGIPSNAESLVLDTFQDLGKVVDFVVEPRITPSSMVIIFAETWSVRRILSQAMDTRGRVMLRSGSHSVRVDQITEPWVELLMDWWMRSNNYNNAKKTSTLPPPSAPQTAYSDLERQRRQTYQESSSPFGGGSSGGGPNGSLISIPTNVPSPNRGRSLTTTTNPGASSSTFSRTMVANSGKSLEPAAFIGGERITGPGAATTPMKPRNGIIQSAMDVLFGW
ncbi:hypothetical protein H4219_005460 [Mycoemilia scoparia]|uniref:RRM domain-containing protein n=1 Tax=Mycoemilia scoparia TaxID=417184 RepID=A0A9W7ZP08_9FUNG|nr:hypothetical protein H4219_005460 [Mycoemilia scoparia]